MDKVSIIGSGSWGTTLAQVLVDNGCSVLLYDVNKENIKKINEGKHPFFNCDISRKIKATDDLDEVIKFSHNLLLSIPSKYVRDFLKTLKSKTLDDNKKYNIISAVKGIELETGYLVSEVISDVLCKNCENIAVLSGPSHAEDVILRKPTLLTCASKNIKFALECQETFANMDYFRVYHSEDLQAVELCGSFKNAIALVCGVMQGKNMGDNARAAILTRSLTELERLVTKYSDYKNSVYGLTGLGDLVATATSQKSRNFRAGIMFSKNIPVEKIEEMEKQTIEGFRAISAFYNLAKKENIQMPIISAAYEVVYKNIPIDDAIRSLFKRSLKKE